jgi:hypothetical protein
MNAAFWLALLKALPLVLELLSAIADRARSARDRGIGYDEAVADGVKASIEGLRIATEAANEAEARHRADPTDNAFDKRFQRDD